MCQPRGGRVSIEHTKATEEMESIPRRNMEKRLDNGTWLEHQVQGIL